jgi:hypothetical protein
MATNVISLTIGNFHDTPINVRKLDKNGYPSTPNRDNILEIDHIYLYHPSNRQDLQSPLALTPLSPSHSLVLIENQYLTGVHSAKDPNVNTYTIFMYLPHDVDHKTTIRAVLTNQFTHMQTTGLPTSPEGLDALHANENSTYPVRPELDDEPFTIATQVIPSQLCTCTYSFTLALPMFSSAAYGLILLASRQTKRTSIPDTLIATYITQSIHHAIMKRIPVIIRSNTEAPKLFRDACNITSMAFTCLRPIECYKIFRASALHTSLKLVTVAEYRYQHERAASAAELSPPLQTLFQVLDAIHLAPIGQRKNAPTS